MRAIYSDSSGVCKAWNTFADNAISGVQYIARSMRLLKMMPGDSGVGLSIFMSETPHELIKLAIAENICIHVLELNRYLISESWPVVDVNVFSADPSVLLSADALASQPNPTHIILPAGHMMSYYLCQNINVHHNNAINCGCLAGTGIAESRSPEKACYAIRCASVLKAYTLSLLGYYSIVCPKYSGWSREVYLEHIYDQMGAGSLSPPRSNYP
jgi:hypothetical protein